MAIGLGASRGQLVTRRAGHRATRRDEAMRLLALVRLEGYADAPASLLSFGQRRLLEIVSTFITKPRIFLLDEPASGVNPSLLAVLGDFVRTMYAERPSIFLLVEHNMEFVMSMAHDIIVMQEPAESVASPTRQAPSGATSSRTASPAMRCSPATARGSRPTANSSGQRRRARSRRHWHCIRVTG